MKYRFWIILFIVTLTLSSTVLGNEGIFDKSGGAVSRPILTEPAIRISNSSRNSGILDFATNITTDGTHLYAVNTYNHTIQKISISNGEVSTLAGLQGVSGFSDGFGSGALFNYPHGITTDGTNLYLADTGNCSVRRIAISTGEVSTLAGAAGKCGSENGHGATAQFAAPYAITKAGTNLYVVDNDTGSIRIIDISSGAVITLAVANKAKSSTDGHEVTERFKDASAVTTDGNNLYIFCNDTKTIRKVVIITGEVTTLAGKQGVLGSADGVGSAAQFGACNGIATDGTNLYIADTYNAAVRKIVISTGEVTTLAGRAGAHGVIDGIGAMAHFNMVAGITIDGNNIYVVNNGNSAIRKIVIASGAVTTLPIKL